MVTELWEQVNVWAETHPQVPVPVWCTTVQLPHNRAKTDGARPSAATPWAIVRRKQVIKCRMAKLWTGLWPFGNRRIPDMAIAKSPRSYANGMA